MGAIEIGGGNGSPPVGSTPSIVIPSQQQEPAPLVGTEPIACNPNPIPLPDQVPVDGVIEIEGPQYARPPEVLKLIDLLDVQKYRNNGDLLVYDASNETYYHENINNLPIDFPVTSVFGRTGDILAVAGDYSAIQITYDNSVSGLSATEVQSAIDELKNDFDTVTYELNDLTDVDITNPQTGEFLIYNNITGQWENNNFAAGVVTSFNGRFGDVIPVEGDYTMDLLGDADTTTNPPSPGDFLSWDGVNWTPETLVITTDFLSLTDTPSSYAGFAGYTLVVNPTEDGLIFTLESGLVDSVFGRTGDVIAQAGDYDSDLITNVSSVAGATVSDALEQLDIDIGLIPIINSTDDVPEGAVNFYWTETRFDASFALKTTDDLTEGATNLYWTQARFDTAFAAKSTDDLSEGTTNLYYTTARFDTDFATKTTDDLSEGTTNVYWTQARFDTAFALKSIDDLIDVDTSTVAPTIGDYLTWDGSDWTPNTFSYDFLSLTDTPASYVGFANQIVGVNAGETGLEFKNIYGLTYKISTDTYQAPPALDGQTQDLGQEIFVNAVDPSLSGATTLNPLVFAVASESATYPEFKEVIIPVAGDLTNGAVYGINTTTVDPVTGKFKLATYGDVNDVDTSAWAAGTILYLDPVTPGGLTDIQPTTDAFVVGLVIKQNATTGAIFVVTATAVTAAPALAPGTYDLGWFTGDVSDTPPYYNVLRDGVGTVAQVIQSQTVDDNQTLPIPTDFLSLANVVPSEVQKGVYEGSVECTINAIGGLERVQIEVYHAQNDGTPIDSGIVSQPIGTLGVRVMTILDSGIRNLPATVTNNVAVSGVIEEVVSVAIGERIRFRILVAKVGTQGGSKTFNVYHGSDHQTFLRVPVLMLLDDLGDVVITTPVVGNILKYNASGIWVNTFVNANEVLYDNVGSGLTAGNVQDAIDEIYNELTITPGYVDLVNAQTAAGVKTWSDQSVFNQGILITTVGAYADSIVFGDGDTAIYENVDDSLIIRVAGGSRLALTETLTQIFERTIIYDYLDIRSTTDGILRLRQTDLTGSPGTPLPGWNWVGFYDGDGDRQGYFGINTIGDMQFIPEISGAKMHFTTGVLINAGVGTIDTGIMFGDGDTAIYEGLDDQIFISIGTNTDQYKLNATGIRTDQNQMWQLRYVYPSGTVPNIVPKAGDTSTGIGSVQYGEFSLIASGIEVAKIDGLAGSAKFILDPAVTLGNTTGLWFGDGDTGIYESTDDNLWFNTAGDWRFIISSSAVQVRPNFYPALNDFSNLGFSTRYWIHSYMRDVNFDAGIVINTIAGEMQFTDPVAGSKTLYELGIGNMNWRNTWIEGSYKQGDTVRDGEWTMWANKDTVDRPAPQPNGNPLYTLGDTPAFSELSVTNVVYSGQTYTFTESGWLKTIRVWIPELTSDTNYRFIIADITDPINPIIRVIEEPVLQENAWSVIAIGESVVSAGTVLRVYIDALNSGSSTNVSGGWGYDGTGTVDPASQRWSRAANNVTIQISKTDLDSVDRTTELLGITANTTLRFVDTVAPENNWEFRATGDAVDIGTSVQVPVTVVGANGTIGIGDACTVDIDIPIAQPTKYSEIIDQWLVQPSFATVEGYLEIGGVPSVVPNNAYGVDIQFQPAYVSPDWDFVATSASGGSGSGGGGDTPWVGDANGISYEAGNVGIGTNSSPGYDLTVGAGILIEGTLNAPEEGLTFGDGDTGFYELVDDQIVFRAGAVLSFIMRGSDIRGTGGSTFNINTKTEFSTTVPIYSNRGDLTTGVGFANVDQIALIAGGIQVAQIDGSSGGSKVIIDPAGTRGNITGLWFGDGDTGIYESVDDNLAINLVGVHCWNIDASSIDANNVGGIEISRSDATATLPIYRFQGDSNTGIGRAGVDQLSLIAGGIEAIHIPATGDMTFTDSVTGTKTLAELAEVPVAPVSSVFTRTGAVVAVGTDYAAFYAALVHTHVKADITDFSDADYATAAQGALADTALQSLGSIGGHTDVDVTTVAPTDGQVLTWVNANGMWEPKAGGSGSSPWVADTDGINYGVSPDGVIGMGIESNAAFRLYIKPEEGTYGINILNTRPVAAWVDSTTTAPNRIFAISRDNAYFGENDYTAISMGARRLNGTNSLAILYVKALAIATHAAQFGVQLRTGSNYRVTFKTDADGSVYFPLLNSSAASTDVTFNSTTKELFIVSSDSREKSNIVSYAGDSLSFINSLQVRTYDRNDGSVIGEIGLIAQELEAVKPEYVTDIEIDDPLFDPIDGAVPRLTRKAIKGSYLKFEIIKAIQQLTERLEALETP